MAYLHSDILDNGLQVLTDDVDELHYCSQEPASYAEVATYSLGLKASPTVSAPEAGDPSGRQVTVSAVVDGAASADGTITHYALVDTNTSRLLAANEVAESKAVVELDTITSDAFAIGLPGVI